MIAEQKKKEHPLGEIPLIVLTARKPEHGPESQALEDDRKKNQAALATLSRNGKKVFTVGGYQKRPKPSLRFCESLQTGRNCTSVAHPESPSGSAPTGSE